MRLIARLDSAHDVGTCLVRRAGTGFTSVWVLLVLTACSHPFSDGPSLSRTRGAAARALEPGARVPDAGEAEVSGAIVSKIVRGSPRYASLIRATDRRLVFKDEEKTAADRMMTPRLYSRLRRLAALVERQWPGVSLRITEAWDEHQEHEPMSLHYEGRAADLTTSDLDSRKLGRLARLAVMAGFDWVYFEDRSHVHASVRP